MKIQINYLAADEKTVLASHVTNDEWNAKERADWEEWLNDNAVEHPDAPEEWSCFELVPVNPVKLTLPGKTDHDQAYSSFLLALDTAIARAKGAGLSAQEIVAVLTGRAAPRGWDSVTA